MPTADEFIDDIRGRIGEGLIQAEAETLCLAYLADPLNARGDRDRVRSFREGDLPLLYADGAPEGSTDGREDPREEEETVSDEGGEAEGLFLGDLRDLVETPEKYTTEFFDKLELAWRSLPNSPKVIGVLRTACERGTRGHRQRVRAILQRTPGTLPAEAAELLSELEEGADEESAEAETAYRRARELVDRGEWERAQALLESLRDDPDYGKAVLGLLRYVGAEMGNTVDPDLAPYPGYLQSLTRRPLQLFPQKWGEFDKRWQEVQTICSQKGISPPQGLLEMYTSGMNIRQAEPLLKDAIDLRERGEFVDADTLLVVAVKLDAFDSRITDEKAKCDDGRTRKERLEALVTKIPPTVDDLVAARVDVTMLGLLAPRAPYVNDWASKVGALIAASTESHIRSAERGLEQSHRPARLSEKQTRCNDAGEALRSAERLSPSHPELETLRNTWSELSDDYSNAVLQVERVREALQGPDVSISLTLETARDLVGALKKAAEVAPHDPDVKKLGTALADGIEKELRGEWCLGQRAITASLQTLQNALEFIGLLQECPGDRAGAIENLRQALLQKAREAVRARFESLGATQSEASLGDAAASEGHEGSPTGAVGAGVRGAVEEALAIADFVRDSLADPLLAQLLDGAAKLLRGWVRAELSGEIPSREPHNRLDEVADIVAYVGGRQSEFKQALGEELVSSLQRQIREQLRRDTLRALNQEDAERHVNDIRALLEVYLPGILDRLEVSRDPSWDTLAEIVEKESRRQRKRRGLRFAVRSLPRAASLAVLGVGIWLFVWLAVPYIADWVHKVQKPGPPPAPVFKSEAILQGPGYDCLYVDGRNICNTPLGPQFKTAYERLQARLGSPVSGAIRESNLDVQYFQYGRLGYHPNERQQYQYQLGNIGQELASKRASTDRTLAAAFAPVPRDPSKGRYHVETQHHLRDTNQFLRFFDANGGIDSFGYPVTEEFQTADGKVVQYFQKGLLEARPGSTPAVVLGDLGFKYLQDVLSAKICHRLLGNENECGER